MDKIKFTKQAPKAPEKREAKKTDGSPKARKTSARLAAVQILYQMRLNNQDAKSAVREFISHRSGFNLDGDVLVPERWSDIDGMVAAALAAGKKGEVETLLESILRAGAWELLANGEVDTGIIIHDYLNVTAAFYEGPEPKLVNAVLDKIAKTVRG